MKLLVTGGAGFIGSALVRRLIADSDHEVLVYDKLTYAGRQSSLATVATHPRYRFLQADICDAQAVKTTFADYRPDAIVHLAAESHVDRSIDGPADFIRTNVVGTFTLLEAALAYWRGLSTDRQTPFRFLHVSTDEVFGALGDEGLFAETTAYDPRSPYSASKAGSDHLVRAWGHTYGLPVLVTNCSNNYGPHQFPEKLVPLMIIRALRGQDLPVYGDGGQVRDWLFVDDHARALLEVLARGVPGRTYNVGARAERRNIEVVRALCALLDRLSPRADGRPHSDQIVFVADRPGHDRRYAIDPSRLETEMGWRPDVSFEDGLEHTVRWYLDHADWWTPILEEADVVGRQGRNVHG